MTSRTQRREGEKVKNMNPSSLWIVMTDFSEQMVLSVLMEVSMVPDVKTEKKVKIKHGMVKTYQIAEVRLLIEGNHFQHPDQQTLENASNELFKQVA